MLRLVWSQLPLKSTTDIAVDALRRSSNSAAVVGKQLFIFGGERVPRVPVDNELWVVGLDDGAVTPAPTSSLRPSARVGASLSYHPGMSALYLWGGRESRDMTPCDTVLWKYSLSSGKWEQSATADKENVAQEDKVAPRSYHAMCTVGNDLYLHAGCPAEGRLATLHSLSLASAQTWSTLPGGPGPGRGGTVLTPIIAPGGDPLLVRYGGFAGHELGGRLDVFNPARGTWSSVAMPGEEGRAGHPLARSVHALVPVRPPVALPASAGHDHGHVVAVLLFGERGPAPAHLGHLGAGTFHRDAWALVCTPAEAGEHFAFVELVQEESMKGGGTPPARGWFAADWMLDGGGAVVVHGGLDDENNRLGDVWLGKLEIRE
ncbi:kelch repeat protein [Mycena pura]|uniref:Kelch repeat protein n=1 Tax=Mycena pura TaxID=153505 RepID=A0AAD7E587_9AGAR|nr:kelch repeat protein [Mycena pura]